MGKMIYDLSTLLQNHDAFALRTTIFGAAFGNECVDSFPVQIRNKHRVHLSTNRIAV